MNKGYSRKGFFHTLLAGAASMLALGFTESARKINKSIGINGEGNLDGIIKIKPLGFQWETSDPFLFCVHHEDHYPAGNEEMGPNASLKGRDIGQDFLLKDGWRMYHGSKVPGFPRHPHRGFETITMVHKGTVDHTDSLGASGRYGGGDVQWMTAGKGVQHAEMFPLINKNGDNKLELFQIWLNLPKAKKFSEPKYKMLWRENIPTYRTKDSNGRSIEVNISAGSIGKFKPPPPPPDSWANDTRNSVAIWTIDMEANAEWEIPAAEAGVNRTLYFFRGSTFKINGTDIPAYHAAELQADQQLRLKNGAKKSSLLMLQGKPIGEPVVQHGPFVMNTKEEINQAFRDFQNTQFGGWPMSSIDPVHPRNKGRFATHSDGREILR